MAGAQACIRIKYQRAGYIGGNHSSGFIDHRQAVVANLTCSLNQVIYVQQSYGAILIDDGHDAIAGSR